MHQRPSLNEAYAEFLLDAQSRRFTADTLRFYRGRLSLFLKWCQRQGLTCLKDLSHTHIRSYLVSLAERDVSSAYAHSHARALRTFLYFCVRDGHIPESPFSKVVMPRLEKKILNALSKSDIKSILDNCVTERDRAICMFLLDSGVRASELIALDVRDVDTATGTVHVRMGKGQKERVTFIGARTRKQLLRYFRTEHLEWELNGPLFVSERTGQRLSYYGLAQTLKRIRKRSGVADCAAHAFRRTFALSCLRSGMNIYVLAKLLGHADLTVLKQYLAIVDNDLQEAYSRYGPVDYLLRG